jgi:hypothetical protein
VLPKYGTFSPCLRREEITGGVESTDPCEGMSRGADTSRYQLISRTLVSMSERLVIPDRADAENELSVAHPWWEFSGV